MNIFSRTYFLLCKHIRLQITIHEFYVHSVSILFTVHEHFNKDFNYKKINKHLHTRADFQWPLARDGPCEGV